jgi:hypothetical protein
MNGCYILGEDPRRYLVDRSDWSVERLYTIPEAAALLRIDPLKLAEAVRAGVVRSIGRTGVPLVRLSDVLAAIDCSQNGCWR